ncbi:hypothetical protein IFM89_014698, partial [Coptis chinensis]
MLLKKKFQVFLFLIDEENLEESNSIDSQEGAQEFSDKAFILSLKKKKEKAKGPDVREEYPKEGPFFGGPTTTTDGRDSILRWYYDGCLCCLDDVAAYHPDRVLRQFGKVQDCDPKYIEWYYSVSHTHVQNPVRCSRLFKHASVVARPTYDEL